MRSSRADIRRGRRALVVAVCSARGRVGNRGGAGPVGVPDPGLTAATVAVYVTVWPITEGFTDETRVVVVPAWVMTCATVLDVDARKLVSEEYTPVIE